MRSNKSRSFKTTAGRTLVRLLLLSSLGLMASGCASLDYQPRTVEEWEAQTRAVQAFTGAVQVWTQGQQPTYIPGAPMRPQPKRVRVVETPWGFELEEY